MLDAQHGLEVGLERLTLVYHVHAVAQVLTDLPLHEVNDKKLVEVRSLLGSSAATSPITTATGLTRGLQKGLSQALTLLVCFIQESRSCCYFLKLCQTLGA